MVIAMKKKQDDQLEELSKQVEEWKNKYLRALADYQNLEKRKEEEVAIVRKFAGEILLTRLLPVADTFQQAALHVKDPGLDLAVKQLVAFFEEQGVEKIETVGKQFNPHEMECIEVAGGKENEVINEVLPGYRLRGKVLRVAQVKVGKEAA
ncbi:MAG: Protein GrpE [Candidatus Gottesmanbacteria bacterium GW2011_GWA2_47_9]|uniref:Protein GrpE n=1 Tax=Candidatus Gottesmanbacteria bacterium GW2011_GWA2_47_9 TaxID=1618445 RepID=A0A0G1WC18_9BACT|nr:MAG: Protein GrpE [Candidatus Gottesmanbacteria bacterium GW2011_GWA2_47_9]